MNPQLSTPWRPAYPIESPRLLLRPHEIGDLDDLVAFHSDPDVVRFIPWPVRTREQTAEALTMRLSRGEVTEEGTWLILAIALKDDSEGPAGTVIGEVLLKCANIEHREGELGYALHAGYHGRGLAFEAASAMLAFGAAPVSSGGAGLRRISATLDERNGASARLLEKLGMTLVGSKEAEFKGEQVVELRYALEVGS